jgi:hypothetical protein
VTPTVQIPQGQTRPALVVTYGRAMPAGFSATYRLHTNVTTFDVPLHVFGGQIRVCFILKNKKNPKTFLEF